MREEESIKVLRKIFNSEKWFGATYDAVFYQEVNNDINVYVNSPHLLRKELATLESKPLISIGATCEPYLNLEREYDLVAKGLEIIREFSMSVVIITAQDLVLRDLKMLESINEKHKAWVVFKMDKYDIALLEALEIISDRGIKAGIIAKSSFLFNSDQELLNRFIKEAKDSGCKFIIPMYLLETSYISDDYDSSYTNQDAFYELCDQYNMSTKMPLFDEEMTNTVQINLFDIFN
ncbi:MAG: hypothetical protein RBQ97_06845 [Acholeplasma sp.]|nr:hypothetical protein [Acholeplasma sp.]